MRLFDLVVATVTILSCGGLVVAMLVGATIKLTDWLENWLENRRDLRRIEMARQQLGAL